MEPQLLIVLSTLAVVVVLIVTEAFRIDVVAILAMLALVWTGSLTAEEARSGFASNAVLAIIGVMIMGHGLYKSGITETIAQFILRVAALLFDPATVGGAALAELPPEYRMPAVARIGGLIKNVAPVFLLCDHQDIGVAERLRDPHFKLPCLYVYDNYPGGIGLAEAFLERMPAILAAASELVHGCGCAEGCPSCVGPRNPEEEIDASPKAAVLSLLNAWLA